MNKNILNYIKTLSDNNKIQELLIKTIGNILLKQDDFELFIKENDTKIIHIRDWITSVIDNNEEWKQPRVLTIDAFNNASNKYFEKKNNKLQTIELDETHEKLIADLGDYYVVQMLTPEALDKESKVMQHCIGHGWYDRNLKKQDYQYLSLRDKFNKAHVTVEIYKNKIEQLQGKQNNVPDKKYLEHLFPWLIFKKYIINIKEYNFIYNENDNKIYSIYNLPDNCRIIGDIRLDFSKLNTLPNNLLIEGNLHLEKAYFNSIPKDIKVKEYIFMYGHKITQDLLDKYNLNNNNNIIDKYEFLNFLIENDFVIEFHKYDLVFNKNDKKVYSIYNLPDNCEIDGNLDLLYKNAVKLPKNLIINGNLDLSFSKIKELPEGIVINGNLNLMNSDIEKLPDNFIVNNLNLDGCINLKELPKNLIINGSADFSYLRVKEIPDCIKINGDLFLNTTEIRKIPNNLVVNGNFNLIKCNELRKISNNLTVNGCLTIYDCEKLKKISYNLIVRDFLRIEKCFKLNSISNNVEVIEEIYIKGLYLKKIADKLKCNIIYIGKNQKDLIEENMNIKKISMEAKNSLYYDDYSKDHFFERYKNEKNLSFANK